MKEFNLEDEKWFKDIFENKEAWVPAYFNDFPRCGLMKTTSRSDNTNSFFNTYSETKNFFQNFMMNYEATIKKQCYTERELDHKTKGAKYYWRSPHMIEQHATKVYTSKVFFEIQKEIYKGGWFCEVKDLGEGDGWEIFKVIHKNQKHEVKATYKVELKYDEKGVSCTYGHFNRFGILCRHAFKVLMDKNFNEIPKQYILSRWTNDVISLNYQLSRDRFDEEDEEVTKLVNEVFLNVETTLDIVRHDKQKLAFLAEKTEILLNEVKSNCSCEKPITNSDILEKLYNVTIPEEVEIFVPEVHHNKISRKKRLIGEVEKSIYECSNEEQKMFTIWYKRTTQ
ncbi:protein FAR-RED ELONGATED HYPOCOTYL 3-like [Lactuca sativa]|nr:protein FAR-RED ELONGATED HYPOCOTYL 3-like [Lactuca sativa]